MIIVLKGGNSAEREVSLQTAKSIAGALKRQDISFLEIDAADKDWLNKVKEAKPTAVIIALHGPYGEDGTVQKILEENSIAYTGSGSKESAITIDKIATKKVVNDKFDIATPKQFFNNDSIIYPAIVKPNKQGSSYGVSIVRNKTELDGAIELAKKYDEDQNFLIEEQIDGRELTCGAIDIFGEITALPLVEIIPNNDFFDYQSKYDTESGCQEICPAKVEQRYIDEIKDKSKKLFTGLGLRQYCRIDWILRDGVAYFLEVNTLPGMTPTSLIIKELAAEGIPYDRFISQLVETARS